jgi:hypothetical protein
MDQQNRDNIQKEFSRLIKELSSRSLWFFKDLTAMRIMDPEAGMVLEKMLAHCNRDQWVRIRKIQKWRLQNIR